MKNDFFLNNLNIEELKSKEKKNESSFVFNNLPNELSVTLGNYYRRIILSYTSGISIFALKMSNKSQILESEFSTLEGLLETPPYLILNLRNVLISLKEELQQGEDDQIFNLEIDIENNSDNDYVVKSGDIKDLSGKLEIIDPDVYIATLSPFSSLKIEIYCRNSWGYKRSDEKSFSNNFDEKKGLILIDSNHNPIINVSYANDFVVTGLEEQNEKLIIKIETNGSLSPKEALVRALKLSLKVNEKVLGSLSNADLKEPEVQ